MWQCKHEPDHRAQLTDMEENSNVLIKKECDLRAPTRDVQCPEHLATFFVGCPQAWAEAQCVPVEQLVRVYWVDFTIPRFNYNRSLLQTLSIHSAALTATPETTVVILISTNCGPYGMEYTDAGVRRSTGQFVAQLSDPDLNIVYRDVTLAFDPTTVPKSRCGQGGLMRGWLSVH